MTEETLIAIEVNATTGEVIERPFTPEEVENHRKIQSEYAKIEKEREEALAAKAAAKASADAKLAALGLTPEEIAAL